MRRGAGDPQQREEDDQQDERGAEVIAGHHQHGQQPGPGQQRDEHVPPVGQHAQLLLAGEQVRAPDRERQLGQLGWLKRHGTECDPAVGTADRLAHAGDQDEREADDRYGQQRVRQGAEKPRRRPRYQPHDRQAHRDAGQLPLEVVVCRFAGGQVGPRGGRQHHHKAQAEQQRGDADDHVVRRERPVEQRAGGAHPLRDPGQAVPQRAAASPVAKTLAIERLVLTSPERHAL
jgi:hypothetical protein